MSDNVHVAAIRYAADQIDNEVKLASSLETIQIVTMNTSFVRNDLAALAAQLATADALLQQAHDAMMDWHFVHGAPSIHMNDEERAMGAACRAIQEYRAQHD